MTQNISELKKQIVQKNVILNSIKNSGKSNKDEIKLIKSELDGLLYQYYKQMKCG